MRWLAVALLVAACSRSETTEDAALKRQLAEAVRARGPGYRPHTRHLNRDASPKFTNRLILEPSPYLIEHAHNPVDWYPWGDAALAKAKRENKPIFLSIGYASCHWCHVMADESFEDEVVAQAINRDFVPVKVDREARPDLDAQYMAAVERMTGDGGWPLTVFLTPDGRAFFGAMYMKREQLLELLARIHKAWTETPGQVADVATKVEVEPRATPDLAVDRSAIEAELRALRGTYDAEWGGFGKGAKFPRTDELALLVREGETDKVVHTLERMAAGAIHDQVGGGFHRYTVDAKWRTPHFEKMLYDQAQIAIAYLEAYQVTGRQDFAEVVRDTLDFTLRELAAPNGALYGGIDADSAGGEGAYYTWTADQIDTAVGAETGAAVRAAFDVHAAGADVLWRPELQPLPERVRAALPLLRAARAKRPPPAIDKKQIAAWNGLALSALARAGFVLDEPRYIAAAQRVALAFPRPLCHYLFEDRMAGEDFLDDNALFEAGLLDLYEADPDPKWLSQALFLQHQLDAYFSERDGGYSFTRHGAPAREPDGNAAAALDLLRLAEFTADEKLRDRALAVLAKFPGSVALAFALARAKQVVIASPSGVAPTALLAPLRTTFAPHKVVVRVPDDPEDFVVKPLVEGKRARNGVPTAYVCRGTARDQPTSDPAVLARQIARE